MLHAPHAAMKIGGRGHARLMREGREGRKREREDGGDDRQKPKHGGKIKACRRLVHRSHPEGQ